MRILIIEDDPDLRELLSSILKSKYFVDAVADPKSARDHIEAYMYGVILVDRNLLGDDIGLTLIAPVKQKNPNCGVLVMSAYGSIEEKIEGLNLGADDYIEKPFDIGELLARINALSRRIVPAKLMWGHISIDMLHRSVFLDEELVLLSKKEDALLFTLLEKMGSVVSRDEIIDSIYQDPQEVASNTIDVMINKLRKKLDGDFIKTIKTRGYIIENP